MQPSTHRRVVIRDPEMEEEKKEVNISKTSRPSSRKAKNDTIVVEVPKKKKNKKQKRRQSVNFVNSQEKMAAGISNFNGPQAIEMWDMMLAAKHYPGRFNTPYVTDMNITSAHTGILSTSISVNQAYRNETGNIGLNNLGYRDYTLIFFAPSFTAYYGSGSADQIPATTKLGGLIINQVDNPSTRDILRFTDFYQINRGCYTMPSIYGSQGEGISEAAFVWASRLDVTFTGAAANLAGTVRIGYFTVDSLYERDTLNTINVNDLLRSCDRIIDLKKTRSFYLQAGVVNHAIANTVGNQVTSSSTSSSASAEEQILGGEIIAYAVIEKPFVSISAATNIEFIMDLKFSSNYVFMPRLWDSFSKGLEQSSMDDDSLLNASNVYEGRRGRRLMMYKVAPQKQPRYNPKYYDPKIPSTLLQAVQRVQKFYADNRQWIDPFVQVGLTAARRMFTAEKADSEGEFLVDQATFVNTFRQFVSYVSRLDVQFQQRYNLPLLTQDLNFVRSANDMFVSYSQFPADSNHNNISLELEVPIITSKNKKLK